MRTIDEKAAFVLEKMKINSAPVSVEDIAVRCHIVIKRASNSNFSGVLLRKEDVAFMAINSDESPTRQRFTIAHELGHFFLHETKETFIDYRDNKKNIVRDKREIDANKFAAALLMPKKLLLKDVKSFLGNGLDKEITTFLAKKYEVSEDAMTFRLMNLNLNI
jgi:Zn-dependent peptidase ImmA (M78 family)